MVNLQLIYKILGSLLFLLGMLMALCIGISVYYVEDDIMPFLLSTVVTLLGGLTFRYLGREATNNLSRRDSYLVVTLAWTIFSLFGTLPFLISGYITSITDAYFEMMSGFSTTGATIIDNVERLPHGLLFWRSLTQWIGGLGIVFFTIAVLPSMVGGSVKVFAAEATGPMRAKMHPRLTTSAKWIWSVYFGLTVACVLSYFTAGMNWFDSINYSMSTTATGGFATHNDSTHYFQQPAIVGVSTLFMFLGGINFTLLYMAVFKRKLRSLLRNSEFRLYLMLVSASAAIITWLLIQHNGYGVGHALRTALFHVVSFVTTTGIMGDDAARWPQFTWIVLGCLMFCGASSGSTTGGFKCIRIEMILKVVRNEFRRILHPNAVLPVKVGDVTVGQSKLTSLLAFFAIYVLMLMLCTTVMIVFGIDHTNALTIALSCISNVGAPLDTQIGPELSWSGLCDGAKWACSLFMLVGRLEIISVLVLFTRSFWKDN